MTNLAFAAAVLAVVAWTLRDDGGPAFRLSLWTLVVVLGVMLMMALFG